MSRLREFTSLQELLDGIIEVTGQRDFVSVETVMSSVGQRSFGPLVLLAGLMVLAPIIGDIPGVPTTIALAVLLLSVQLMFNRDYFWLPRWLLNKSVPADTLRAVVARLRPPARFVDRWLRPRLTIFIRGQSTFLAAVACMLIAAAMPLMEVVPFSANAGGAALTLFGLAFISRDGLMALMGFVVCAFILGLPLYAAMSPGSA